MSATHDEVPMFSERRLRVSRFALASSDVHGASRINLWGNDDDDGDGGDDDDDDDQYPGRY